MNDDLQQLQERLDYRFLECSLLEQAVTHASAAAGSRASNERLEFLGDAVVGVVISGYLYRTFPQLSEGQMTRLKSAVVSRRTLARVGRLLGLPQYLRVDEGLRERRTYTVSMVAGVYEAVVGAIFMDGGLDAAGDFVLRTLGPEVEAVRARRHTPDHKSILQQRTQAEGKGAPAYGIARSEGPDHERLFQAVVRIQGEQSGTGWGPTKQAAEQNAACEALDKSYPGWADHEEGELPGR